jgi:hypothetical protein
MHNHQREEWAWWLCMAATRGSTQQTRPTLSLGAPDVNRDGRTAPDVPLQRSRNGGRCTARAIRASLLSQQGARESTMSRKGEVHGVQCGDVQSWSRLASGQLSGINPSTSVPHTLVARLALPCATSAAVRPSGRHICCSFIHRSPVQPRCSGCTHIRQHSPHTSLATAHEYICHAKQDIWPPTATPYKHPGPAADPRRQHLQRQQQGSQRSHMGRT